MVILRHILREQQQKRNLESIFRDELWPNADAAARQYHDDYEEYFHSVLGDALISMYIGGDYDFLYEFSKAPSMKPVMNYIQGSWRASTTIYRGLCIPRTNTGRYESIKKNRRGQELTLTSEYPQAFSLSRQVARAFARGAEGVGKDTTYNFDNEIEHLGLVCSTRAKPQQVLFFSKLFENERYEFVGDIYHGLSDPQVIDQEKEVVVDFVGGRHDVRILEEYLWDPRVKRWRNVFES